ncbi:unnamed protein product [Orchesella dallaii]|uniref:Major facilitator superfamily (MFS) profile domain-containing protein n=1 Tax=Orchesella dallaii TaxID=48710 RepID=A0ABP1PPS8_9HEXA
MSRTPGLFCLIDVRSAAILQDQILKSNKCAPGAKNALRRRQRFGGRTLLENCEDPACGFDRNKDFISVVGGMIVVATIMGILNSLPLFIPHAALEYEAGYIELNLIWASSLLVLNITDALSSPIIEYAGHRLTALFGMLFVFVGVLLDSQVFGIEVLWVSYVGLVGIGGGLAYSASMTLPADLFRKRLAIGLMIMCIAGNVGTIFYCWFVSTVLVVVGYKWTKLMLAILVLFFTLAVHVYPKTRLMYASGCAPDEKRKDDKATTIRECVYKTVKAPKNDQQCEQERHCKYKNVQQYFLLRFNDFLRFLATI